MSSVEFEEMVRSHQAEVYRYLRYLGADRATCEDLIQETFMAAFRSQETSDSAEWPVSRRAAWLRGVARNQFLMYLRKRRSEKSKIDGLAMQHTLQDAETVWAGAFVRDGDGFDYVEGLRECLQRLPVEKRKVLDLFYRDSKSRSEIAGLLQTTEDGVKSILRRIRETLGDCVSLRVRKGGAS